MIPAAFGCDVVGAGQADLRIQVIPQKSEVHELRQS